MKEINELNNLLSQYVDKGFFPGVQWQINIDDNEYAGKYGLNNIDTKQEVFDNSIYRIWSMTKPIVAIAALKLVEEKGDKFYKMTGDVSTANNGGFIQFRADLRSLNLNDNNYEGLRLLVRGNGEVYNIHIRTGMTFMPWQYYSVEFKTSPNWNEVVIPFSNFKRSNFYQPRSFKSKDIATLGIVAYGRDYKADIDLAKIEFY